MCVCVDPARHQLDCIRTDSHFVVAYACARMCYKLVFNIQQMDKPEVEDRK